MGKNKIYFFKIILADRKIEVECHYRVVYAQCKNYLADFEKPDFVVRAPMDEIISKRADIPEMENHDPRIAIRYADEYMEPLVVYQKIADKLIAFDTLLMHGAVVATECNAYMLTAPSGVGKSTRAKIWLDEYPGSIIVNGDKPLIKVTDTEILACGTPWCGKEEWNTNIMVPLRAVFLLERANEEEKTTIEEISIGKAFPTLLQQTYRPDDPEAMRKTIQLLKSMEGRVRFYHFHSTPTPEAVRLAYETARPR